MSTFYFFDYFSQKSTNFYNFWCTHIAEIFNNFCNFAYVKFHLACGEAIMYLRCIQFSKKAMET